MKALKVLTTCSISYSHLTGTACSTKRTMGWTAITNSWHPSHHFSFLCSIPSRSEEGYSWWYWLVVGRIERPSVHSLEVNI
eukprot:scaffold472_cov215-Alexandrium_tamarense.AAC.8